MPRATIVPFPEFHPTVVAVAKSLYESEHYTHALKEASIRLEEVCNEILKKRTGEDLTGVPLMQKLFSYRANSQDANNEEADQEETYCECVLPIANLSSRKGIETQKNFCNLYTGYMGAIRNTLAHSTTELAPIEALYGLNIVSYLFCKLDSALENDDVDEEPEAKNIPESRSTAVELEAIETSLFAIVLADAEIQSISARTTDKANAKLSIRKRVEEILTEQLDTIGEKAYNTFFSNTDFQERMYSLILDKIYE